MMDESLRDEILTQLNELISNGAECFLCNNPARISCIPGPKDQLKLMQALPDEHKGSVHGIGFPLCEACVTEAGTTDWLCDQAMGILTKKSEPKKRDVRLAQVIPLRKKLKESV